MCFEANGKFHDRIKQRYRLPGVVLHVLGRVSNPAPGLTFHMLGTFHKSTIKSSGWMVVRLELLKCPPSGNVNRSAYNLFSNNIVQYQMTDMSQHDSAAVVCLILFNDVSCD